VKRGAVLRAFARSRDGTTLARIPTTLTTRTAATILKAEKAVLMGPSHPRRRAV